MIAMEPDVRVPPRFFSTTRKIEIMAMTDYREDSRVVSPTINIDPLTTVNGQVTPVREDRVRRAQMFIELGKMDSDARVERALDRILDDFDRKLRTSFGDDPLKFDAAD